MILITHLQAEQRLRMTGAIHLLPLCLTWHGQGFYLYLYHCRWKWKTSYIHQLHPISTGQRPLVW